MIDLTTVKQALRIDFDDQDVYLQRLIDAAENRAKTITGMAEIPYETYHEIENAIIEDVKAMYEGSESNAIIVYRRYSTTPMM